MSILKARCNRSRNWKCNSSRKDLESSKIYITPLFLPTINRAGQNRWAPCRWYRSQNWGRARIISQITEQNLRKIPSSIQSQRMCLRKLLLMRCQTQVKEISFRIKCCQNYKWASSQTPQHLRRSISRSAQLLSAKLTGVKSSRSLRASATNSCRVTFQPTQPLLIPEHSDLETRRHRQLEETKRSIMWETTTKTLSICWINPIQLLSSTAMHLTKYKTKFKNQSIPNTISKKTLKNWPKQRSESILSSSVIKSIMML